MKEQSNKERTIPVKHVFGYGIGMLAVTISFSLVLFYLPYFYTDVFLLSPAVMGVLFITCRVWDGINDPIMGIIADNTNTRWGRFRPYLLFMVVPMIVFTALTFYVPDMSPSAKIVWAFVTYISLQMIKTVYVVPYFSLAPIITTDIKERTEVSTVQNVGSLIAAVAVSAVTLKIVEHFPTEREGFFYTALMFAVIAGLVMLIPYWTTRHYDYPGAKVFQRKDPAQRYSLKDKLRVITKNPPFLILVFSFLSQQMYGAVFAGMAIYFYKNNVGLVDKYPQFLASVILIAIIGAALTPAVTRKISRKTYFHIANIMVILMLILTFYLSMRKTQAVLAVMWMPGSGICYFLMLVLGLFMNVNMVIYGAMLPDCVDFAEWKTGQRAEGLMNAVYLMANKGGMALGGAIMGIGLALVDYKPNLVSYPERTLFGIMVLYFLFPLLFRMIMSILMLFYNLTESKYHEIQAELEARLSDR